MLTLSRMAHCQENVRNGVPTPRGWLSLWCPPIELLTEMGYTRHALAEHNGPKKTNSNEMGKIMKSNYNVP